MKRPYRKRLFIELIILGILFIMWVLIGDKSWMVSLWNFLKPVWEYIYKERMWTFPVFVGFVTLLVMIVLHIKSQKPKPSEIIPPKKPEKIGTFEVENVEQLGKVRKPFMEDLVVGKFIDITEGKAWDDIKNNEVDFSKLQPLDLAGPHRIFIIKGKPAIGKSTYMLWSLDESLRNKSWMFNKILFLNPYAYERWAEELSEYDPGKTLLIIDALRRDGDTNEDFERRCSHLFSLASGLERIGERIIGPFKVIITIRDSEYDYLERQKDFGWISDSVFLYEITSEKLDLEKIIEKYLQSYKVKFEGSENQKKAVINQLISKSEGLPFYIRHVIVDLKRNNKNFSEEILKEYPPGMVNLIWQTIRRGYYIKNDPAIPFLLLSLLDTDKDFSSYYFDFVIERISTEKEDARNKVESFKEIHLQRSLSVIDLKDAESFSLDSHWKTGLRSGLEQSDRIRKEYKDVVDFYKRIKDEQYHRLKQKITSDLKIHLQEGFKDKADIFRCVDLAKMEEEDLETATKIYTRFCSSSKLPQEYINYIRDELYELWISNAWKYRADPYHEPEDVIRCYENAFDKLGIRSHLKQLSAFAYYLQTNVLPKSKYGTPEFQQWKEKIEKLHKEVIKSQLEQSVRDPLSYQKLALFYEDVGEDDKAEKTFQESLEISPLHIPTNQAYAIFLKGRGKREWVRNRTKALEYYKKAEEQFKKTIEILESKKKELAPKEIEEYEKRLLNAYALFLIDKTEWEREFDKRIKIDEKVDELFDELLRKYPDHGRSINAYSHFLMGYGRILPKYRGGKNLEKAEKLLKDFIAECNKKEKELSYYVALHILAVYYYRIKPSFYKQRPNLEEVIGLLKESSKSFNPFHNSIAYNELGRLYTIWANILKRREPIAYNEKMNLAKEAYEKAMEIVPENRQSAIHLSKVYFNYAFYLLYIGQAEKSETYIQKALEVTEKFAYIPFNHYYSLTALGDDILKDHNLDIAIKVFTEAKQLGERLEIKPWYPIYKLGEICKEKQDIDKALEYYLQSAQLENTSEGWGTRRDSIKQLMKDYNIKKDTQTALYERCIKARIYCSEQAYKLNPNHYKNCGDYGEDLLGIKEYEQAISILERGVSLIQQSEELNEVDKRKKLSWFYEKIGFCYKDQGNLPEAEKYLHQSAETEDSAIGYFRLIGWMFDLENYEKTLLAFQKFVGKFPFSEEEKGNIFPHIADVSEKVAESYKKLNKDDEAAIFWKYYADVSFYSKPKEEAQESCGVVGNTLLKMYKFIEARECFLKSIRLDPNFAQNFSQLGYINRGLRRWEECKICSERAFFIRGDSRDRRQYEYCQKEYKKNPKVYDTNKIDDLIDLATIAELKGEIEKALKYYSDALTILRGCEYQGKTDISRYMFIADAFWALGHRDDALKVYKEIKDIVRGYEKIMVEAIIWVISMQNKVN